MSWANYYIQALKDGKTISFRPRGNSMKPHIKSGQLVTVEPITRPLKERDIVLATVRGKQYLHFVQAIKTTGDKTSYQIANASGFVNGWTIHVHGIVTKIGE